MKFRKRKQFHKSKVIQARFQPTKERLDEICRLGAELLLNTPPDELKKFTKR